MKKQKIILITILFLCVILSIVIIKQNTNIEKKTKVIKQMSESEQVSNYEAQINQYIASHTEYANSIQTAKKNLAEALTNEGVATTENDTFETMTTNIAEILQARTSDATATAEDIAEGKTAYVNGELINGIGKGKLNITSFNYRFESWGSANISVPINNYYSDWVNLTSDNIFVQYNGGTAGNGGGGCNARGTYDSSTGVFKFNFGINNKQNSFTIYIITCV